MALCKLESDFPPTPQVIPQRGMVKKRRRFVLGKERRSGVRRRTFVYVEDTQRSRDTTLEKIKFFSEDLILAQDEHWRR